MRVGIYSRVSTDIQLDNFSLSMQNDRCHAQALAKGWTVHKIYAEQVSGKSLNRTAYNEMINDLKQGIIQGVIIFKLDRLSRNPSDTYHIINLFTEHKWGLLSVTESLDISSPAGIMLIQVLASFAQYERSTIKQRMVDGFNQKKKQGGKVGGDEASLYGYTRNDAGNIVIEESEAQVIREVFRMRADGYTTRAISKDTKSKGIKNRTGTIGFSHVQIAKQLKHENIYKGIEPYKGGGGFMYPAIL
jgi:site-specific DNA recombinase